MFFHACALGHQRRALDVNRPVGSRVRSWGDAGSAGTDRDRGINIPRTPFQLFYGDGKNFSAFGPPAASDGLNGPGSLFISIPDEYFADAAAGLAGVLEPDAQSPGLNGSKADRVEFSASGAFWGFGGI